MDEPPVPTEIAVSWPLGPLYYSVGPDGRRSWVIYKFTSARWYVDTLEQLIGVAGFDSYVGVEMALDGALASLNSAFDATVGSLIQESEVHLHYLHGTGKPLALTPQHSYSHRLFKKQMGALSELGLKIEVASVEAKISAALRSEIRQDGSIGWLQEFRRIRNQPMHHGPSSRNIGHDWVTTLWVGEEGRNPVHYLREIELKMNDLVMPVLDIIESLVKFRALDGPSTPIYLGVAVPWSEIDEADRS